MNGFRNSFFPLARIPARGWVLLLLTAALCLTWKLTAGAAVYPSRIFSNAQAVAAVCCGDFDPIHPGNELACLLSDGSVVELALGTSGWAASTNFVYRGTEPPRWEDPRTRVSLNVGDVLSEHAGRELVLSYDRQVVAVYYTASDGWTNQTVADYSDMIGTSWGAETGDCDRAHVGDEVFSIHEGVLDFSSGRVFGKTNGAWQQNLVYNAEVGMDAAIGDSNPDFPGDEIIIVTEMGPAYEITPPAGGGPGLWPGRTIWDDFDNAGWVVKIGDVEPEKTGNEIVYGTRYSDRILMSCHNGTNRHNVEILFTGTNTNFVNSMFDLAIGQVFPASPTAEILGVDDSGSVYVVQRLTNQWQGSVLWRDTNALYAVLVADLMPTVGHEVIVAGASGAVTLLSNPSPVLNAMLTAEKQPILSWTGVAGLTYAVETATDLRSGSSWTHVTNLAYQGGFHGTLSYTNAQPDAAPERFFRVSASW